MATYQQRIALKGQEGTIAHFTNLLREVKGLTSVTSAETLEKAIAHWKSNSHAYPVSIPNQTSNFTYRGFNSFHVPSRVFYLQILTSTESMSQLTLGLERLKRDQILKLAIESYSPRGFFDHSATHGGSAEFHLAALVLLLEFYKKAAGHSKPVAKPPVSNLQPVRPFSRLDRGQSMATPSTTDRSLRGMSLDCNSNGEEDKYRHHLVSWRTRIRDQQLAENRRLNETIRNSLSRDQQSMSPLTKRRYFRTASPSPLRNLNEQARRHLEDHDNRAYDWTPVHQVDIRRRSIENQENCPPILHYDLSACKAEALTFKERKSRADRLSSYLVVVTPDERAMPGFDGPLNPSERIRHGCDCDEVYPRIILGNGATVRKKDYLKQIGITHVLNAAEFRGVNVGEDYFRPGFKYMGLRVEDTPQTQICR